MGKLMPRLVMGLAAATLAAVSLTGCEATPTPSKTPTPTATPVFSSDAAALAAAKKAYAKYLKVSDEIAHDGGADPARIKPYVSAGEFKNEIMGFKALSTKGLKTTGTTSFDTVTLQQYDDHGNGKAEVDLYLCGDVSSVRVVNASGSDVTPKDRTNRLPLTIGFLVSSDPNKFRLTKSDTWSGKDFC